VKNTSAIGNRSLAIVTSWLLRENLVPYLPFGDGGRCDLLVEVGTKLIRVQVKTGQLVRGGTAIAFPKQSYPRPGVRRKYTAEEIDLFAVVHKDVVYWIPLDGPGQLRLTPPLNGQKTGIHYAATYEKFPGL
jgi:hypothetical protein